MKRWKDIENGILTVEQAVQRQGKEYKIVRPKTDRGRRSVPLTKRGVDALVAHHDRPTAAVVSLAHLRNEKAFPDLVFRAANGEPLNGSYDHHRFQAAAKQAGLPVCRFHDLRHACASLLASMGVPLIVVSQILGHSSVKLTGDTYTHLYAPALRGAADAMEAALR